MTTGNTGLYHRKFNPFTQTRSDALKQQASGEIWGKPARGSNIPCVKAYFGGLPPLQQGIEFHTSIPHDPRFSTPFEARWYHPHTSGVKLNAQGYAVIPATVIRIV
jgi:hypothetical protein